MVCIILFLAGLITMKIDKNNGKVIHNFFYEHNFNFAKVNQLYKKYFGSILPFDNITKDKTNEVFNEKIKYNAVNVYKDGAKLSVENNYLIPILESGVVIFIGDKEEYGQTVIIQQVNGIDVWYCNVTNINVNLYDYVSKGEFLAEAKNKEIYLLFQKKGAFLDYKEYLS